MRKHRWATTIAGVALVTCAGSMASRLHAQAGIALDVTRGADGAALYKTYCALCHEGPRADAQALSLEAMRRLTAEQVLEALERGVMRARAAERSRAQRRALAIHVSGRPLADTSHPMPKAAFCAAAPGASPRSNALGGRAWNGWGNSIGNTRFQSTDAAGLRAEDVPRLTLKWAFGFPGATSAGTQPVVAGGRVYVATAEGELYVLDAKTGCVHWTLERPSVRAGVLARGIAGRRRAVSVLLVSRQRHGARRENRTAPVEDVHGQRNAGPDNDEQHRDAALRPGGRRHLEHADHRRHARRAVRRHRKQFRAAIHSDVGFAARHRARDRARALGPPDHGERHLERQLPRAES